MKWMKLLIAVMFGFCASPVFAQSQSATDAAKASSATQPAPVAQTQGDQAAPVDQGTQAAPADQEAQAAPADQGAQAAPVDQGAQAAPVNQGTQAAPQTKAPINFGDYRSSTLTTKAWQALDRNDIEAVLAYTNKCIDLYSAQAKKMEADLKDYPTGENKDIFKYWALNDVATSYYIQGEAYRKANMSDEAKEAYNHVVKDYTYGQAWDPKGWFWKPAEAAKEKLAMIKAGVNWDFGDYSSNQLVQKAWAALAANDLKAVEAYANKTVELYSAKAKDMQASLKEYPWKSKDKILSYWALNDVGTSLFVLGEAYQNAGDKKDAAAAYKKLIDEYSYAQCWDPGGWFWKPAEAAQQKLGELNNV